MAKNTHFKIVINAYNASRWIVRCLSSVALQRYNNWQAIIHIEPSEDATYKCAEQFINRLKDDRFVLIHNTNRRLRSINDFEAIRLSNADNEDVIMFLDGDDWLYGSKVFSYLDTIYKDSNIWVTWGSYIHSHDNSIGKASVAVPSVDDDPFFGNNRRRCWGYSHLKTFRYFVFRGIKDEDLRDSKGKYYLSAWDMALMFPLIEIAGEEHRKFIDKVLYVYNTGNPISNDKVFPEKCILFRCEILAKTPYNVMTRKELYQCQPMHVY